MCAFAAAMSDRKTELAGPGRVLAIDYGQKRLGLAISDALRVTSRPLATWKRSNLRRDLARLRDFCKEEDVSLIVIGLPLRMKGESGAMTGEVNRFAEKVRAEVGRPVELVDERLSSWEAAEELKATRAGRARLQRAKSRDLDEVAAAVILREYLQRESGRR